ncbi:glycosyltransferase [Halobacterium salinarum]|uniref:glycosyltransferase n=1 Tax=Halobacterium salinarum TaxID=2242 RepID=UPI00255222BB|nr:glycosyltransferase [Halobacterium salinarum]MDL0145390.1 glycosyltransferase [Halobacterium salinarum]
MNESPPTVFFASGSSKNPYHRLLFDSLGKQGITVIEGSPPRVFPLTRSLLRNPGIDIIHLDWLYRFYFVRGFSGIKFIDVLLTILRAGLLCVDVLIVKVLRVKLAWTVHNKFNHERDYYRTEVALNIIISYLVDSITVKCPSAKDIISNIYRVKNEGKIDVIPDGNYINAYPNEVDRQAAREALGIEKEKFIYLFFGSVRRYKGVRKLVSSFQHMNLENSELWIVGNPRTNEIKQTIQKMASNSQNVEIVLEFVPESEVQYYMNAADTLVLPYRDILNSGTVMLGLTFSLPIIAPAIGCIPNVVNNEYGILYQPERETALEAAMHDLKSEKNQREMGREAYNAAKEMTWDKYSEEYAAMYERLAT